MFKGTRWKSKCINYWCILYIKATVVSVYVGNAWKILPVTARSLWSPFPVCGDKQGRARQGRAARAAATGG